MSKENINSYSTKIVSKLISKISKLQKQDPFLDCVVFDIIIKPKSSDFYFYAPTYPLMNFASFSILTKVVAFYLSEFKQAHNSDKKLCILRLVLKKNQNSFNTSKPIEIDMTTKN